MNLPGRRTFRHGVHPPPEKAATRDLPIRRFPFAPELVLPLAQHAGPAAAPLVREGQEVVRGQLLAEATEPRAVPLHAPATGTVVRLDRVPTAAGNEVPGLYLAPLPASTQEVLAGTPCPPDAPPEAIVAAVRAAGIVGLGGAAFPTYLKLRIPPDKRVDTLIINGAECEPYLTADHRVMLEQAADVAAGVGYLLRATGASRAILASERHSREGLAAIAAAAAASGVPLETCALAVKYPQGAEKVLIRTLLGREVPSGGLPLDVHALCINVATTAEIGRLLPLGDGIQERVITVSGPCVVDKGNFRIPIGTPVRFVLEHLGVTEDAARVFLGGPMMGQPVADLDVPVTKGTGGIVVLPPAEPVHVYPCIHCGYCVEACPLFLNPSQLGVLARNGEHAVMRDDYRLFDCFECGACAYVCPSHLPLVQEFRAAKTLLRRERPK